MEIDFDHINKNEIAFARQKEGNSDSKSKVKFPEKGSASFETAFKVEKYFSTPKLQKQFSFDQEDEDFPELQPVESGLKTDQDVPDKLAIQPVPEPVFKPDPDDSRHSPEPISDSLPELEYINGMVQESDQKLAPESDQKHASEPDQELDQKIVSKYDEEDLCHQSKDLEPASEDVLEFTSRQVLPLEPVLELAPEKSQSSDNLLEPVTDQDLHSVREMVCSSRPEPAPELLPDHVFLTENLASELKSGSRDDVRRISKMKRENGTQDKICVIVNGDVVHQSIDENDSQETLNGKIETKEQAASAKALSTDNSFKETSSKDSSFEQNDASNISETLSAKSCRKLFDKTAPKSSSSSSKDNSFEADEIKRFGEITKPFSNLKTNNSASTSVAASMAKESSNISSLSSGHCHFKGPTGGTQMSISKKYKKCECEKDLNSVRTIETFSAIITK